jgi:NADH-quinone oxidoreductase subunit M
MLWMFQRAIVQDKSSGGVVKMRDITGRHIWGLVPLIVLIFAMGIYPDFFLAKLEPTMSHYLVDILGIR